MARFITRVLLAVCLLCAFIAPAFAKDKFHDNCPEKSAPFVAGPGEFLDIWAGNADWSYSGCFKDEYSRFFPNGSYISQGWRPGGNGSTHIGSEDLGWLAPGVNAPDNCARICQMAPTGHANEVTKKMDFGLEWAAVQRSDECYCLRQSPPPTTLVDDSLCNWKCPDQGKHGLACGGDGYRSVYRAKMGRRGQELWKGQARQRGQSSAGVVGVRARGVAVVAAVGAVVAVVGWFV